MEGRRLRDPWALAGKNTANSSVLLLSIARGSESLTGGHQFNLTAAQDGLPPRRQREKRVMR